MSTPVNEQQETPSPSASESADILQDGSEHCFDELDPELIQAIDEQGFAKPTPIQQAAIPAILTGQDVMAGSKTGSGKTAAFVLPLLSHLLNSEKTRHQGARALILTPTRELAKQISYHVSNMARHTPLSVATVIGGVSYQIQDQQLSDNPDIIVSTPGRLLEMIRTEQIDLFDINHIVLDEADRMLDMGFASDVLNVMQACPDSAQILLFSATLEGPQIEKLARQILHEPVVIDIDGSRAQHENITQYIHLADTLAHKQQLLLNILRGSNACRVLVFVKSRDNALKLSEFLNQQSLPHGVLYGELKQKTRSALLAKMRKGDIRVMVSTDLSSRGLDIEGVSHVINFDMPRRADIYVHRIGRTGRTDNQGTAISLVEAHDYPLLEKIQRYLKTKLQRRTINGLEPKHKAPGDGKGKTKSKGKNKGKAKANLGKPHKAKKAKQNKKAGKG